MTDHILPPPCPNCAGPTTLKSMQRMSKAQGLAQGFMCFFHCAPCALQYPRAVEAGALEQAGLRKPGAAVPPP